MPPSLVVVQSLDNPCTLTEPAHPGQAGPVGGGHTVGSMPLPRRRHTAFEPTALHDLDLTALRACADTLPAAPGVYIFHGQVGDLPVYIGKSVNLRQRVLSHLRAPDEARMLRQTTHISHIRTAGDIGAQLLEARLIKQQHPLMNQKLRRNRQLCALHWPGTGAPEVVQARDIDFATTAGLYGLYASRHAAVEALHSLADEHRLCLGLLGLERLSPGRPCFRALLGRCGGCCRGDEPQQAHDSRLRQALAGLQLACWPHPGAVGLIERWEGWQQIHVVRNWCYLGSVNAPEQAASLLTVAAGFDADGYRILCRPMLEGTVEWVDLSNAAGSRRAGCGTPARRSRRAAGAGDAPRAAADRSGPAGAPPGG